jgi:transposase
MPNPPPPAVPDEPITTLEVPASGLQRLAPIFPTTALAVTSTLAVQRHGDSVCWFTGTMPVFTHAASDEPSFRMFVAQLCAQKTCSQAQIIRAFGVAKISVVRWVAQYQKEGPGSFFRGRKPAARGDGPVLSTEMVAQAEQLLASGRRRSEVAEALGLKYDTLQKAIRHGKIRMPEKGG